MHSSMRFYGIEGPVWLPANAPARTLYKPVGQRRAKVLFLGASVSQAGDASPMEAAGWLSRGVPLLLSESAFVLLGLDTVTLLPWSLDQGFAVWGQPWSADDAAIASERAGATLCVVMHVIAKPETATLAIRVLRSLTNGTAETMGEWTSDVSWKQPDGALHGIWARLANTLVAKLGDAPTPPSTERYRVPYGTGLPAYLLTLEGVCGLRCQGSESGATGTLPGQHAVTRQILNLAQAHPASLPARLLLHEGLLRMRTLDKPYTESLAEEVMALHRNAAFRDDAVGAILEQQLRLLFAG